MKKSASHESKSLKTFFVYAAIVLFFIFISLSVKAVFVVKASKFDGDHQFLLAVNKEQKLKEVIAFDPSASEVSVLAITGELSQTSANQILGFIPDGTVDMGNAFEEDASASEILRTMGVHYGSIKTNITFFDIIRLAILSHKTAEKQHAEIAVKNNKVEDTSDIKKFFADEAITSEDITIQIINASGTSGMGKRLENVLTNLGYNVVSVTTSAKQEKNSKIQYFGKESYTLNKLKKTLPFPEVILESQQIADIVIVLGEDSKNSIIF